MWVSEKVGKPVGGIGEVFIQNILYLKIYFQLKR